MKGVCFEMFNMYLKGKHFCNIKPSSKWEFVVDCFGHCQYCNWNQHTNTVLLNLQGVPRKISFLYWKLCV